MQAHMILFNGNTFAHHPTADVPISKLRVQQVFTQLVTNHICIRPRATATTNSNGVTTKEVCFLFANISEPRNVSIAWIASVGSFAFETFVLRIRLTTIVMP